MADNVQYLTTDEIEEFLNDLDKDKNGNIDYYEVECKLDEVHKELAPKPLPHHLHHKNRDDKDRHEFLRSIVKTEKDSIPRAEFAESVKEWRIPSMKQDTQAAKDEVPMRHIISLHKS